MEPWTAWSQTRAVSFLHARVRGLLAAQGVEDTFLQVDGSPVHVYAAGPKDARRTVILLHGLGDSANNWFRTLPLLAWRGDRVLAPDLPGHGWSPPPDARGFLHIREHARVVRSVYEQARASGDDVALVGHSLGGWVAARLHLGDSDARGDKSRPSGRDGVAARLHLGDSDARGALVGLPASRLVLVESAGLAYEGMWDSIEMLRIEHEADVKKFFKTVMHKTPAALHILSKEVAAMFRSPAVVNFIGATNRDDIIDDAELARVTAQTTILWGENDGLIPPILAHRWQAGIPNARLVWMPKCGHAPQFERPIMFQNLIEEALGHAPFPEAVAERILARVPPPVRKRLPWA